jgi:hypothetical protein
VTFDDQEQMVNVVDTTIVYVHQTIKLKRSFVIKNKNKIKRGKNTTQVVLSFCVNLIKARELVCK